MNWSVIIDVLPSLGEGLSHSLYLCLIAGIGALILGALLATVMLRGTKLLRSIVVLYSDLTLTLPLLTVIYLLYFVLPEYNVILSSFTVGLWALIIYYAPYIAQVIRAAIITLPNGQWEACRTLGITKRQTLWRVVLPQCIPKMLSPIVGLMIGLIKDSALLSVISVHEFMFAAKEAISETYAPLEIYLTVAVTYWVLNSVIDVLARFVEQRMTRYLQDDAA